MFCFYSAFIISIDVQFARNFPLSRDCEKPVSFAFILVLESRGGNCCRATVFLKGRVFRVYINIFWRRPVCVL